ncbi:MAG: hypothetical protein J7J61_02460, partial [Candidatus Hydrothermae bacterium]|nr:hypothetical protein [Candidatus Hydrothermae bacterium]
MKRGILSSIALMIFMVLPQDVFALTRYSEKVWYEKPAFTLTPQPNSEFLTFMSNLTADRVILLPKGKILLRRGDLLEIYGPDFDVIRYFKNLKKTIGWDEVHGYGVLIPSRDGKKLIIGFANRELRQYNLVLFNLETGEHKFLTTLDKMHFPGIAPIKRAMEIIKTDPEFANIYFSRVYNSFDFEDGTWIDDKIYLWFAPEYGLHFGGLLVYDLSIGQLTPFLEKADHIIGVSKDGLIAYTHLKDDNATELDKAIYIKTTKSTIRIPDASIEKGACFNGEILVYTTHDKKVVFYSVKKKTPVASFNMPGKDFRMIELSPSGNRLFFTAQIETAPPTLYVYDTRDRKYYPIITDGRHIDTISFLNSSNDGEFVVFREGSRVWASYLTDYSAPQITLKINPLYKNKAFTESVTVKAYAEDMCFTSGIQEPAIEFDKKKYRSGDEIKVILKEGENILIFKASDRAGNVN